MIDLNKALFYDIETHYAIPWEDRPKSFQDAFINHYYDDNSYESPKSHYEEIAGLYAELSHVICIVFGYICPTAPDGFKTIVVQGADEVKILEDSKKIFDAFAASGYYMVGFNSDTCDGPYMAKRYMINGMKVPGMINTYGVKPWDSWNLDVMKLWQFNDYKRTSLEMACAAFNIPCKEDELGGGNLYRYPLSEMPWDELSHYCTQDVVSLWHLTEKIVDCIQ